MLDLGLAANLVPRYPGSDETVIRPRPLIGVERLTLPVVGVVADGPAKGVFVYPAFRVDGARETADHPELAGMRDVDWG
ncbi:MAG: MipA/OmpV family protein, partial [Planctomycetaceae bacterium]